ncbi:MAG: extracellular solute-binding protein [Clostridia bacterium]|nr:extracellular solute-binding protein [Clostridia bacterium]MBR1684688.1 extracellular solute-binding protein [Clostridia bacterium]
MKKRISLLVAMVMALSIIVAAVPAMADKTVITYWSNDRHDEAYMSEVIDKFNAEHDDIEINMVIMTDDFENSILLAIDGGTAPDIVGQAVTIKNMVDYDAVVDLTPYIEKDEEYQKVNDPFNHKYEGLNAIGDAIYWVPSGQRSGVRIEYNKALLEASGFEGIPATLPEYIEMAKKITEDGKANDPVTYGIGFTSSSPFERQLEMMAQVSGVFYYDYANGKFDFTGYKPFLEAGRELVAVAYPDQQGVDNMRAQFAAGAFALWGNASQEAGVFTSQFPITDFEWGVSPVPSLDGEIKGALQVNPNKGYLILKSSKNQDAAWEVVRYLQSEEVLVGYMEGGFDLPITSYIDERVDKSKMGRMGEFSLLDYESVYPAVPTINLLGDDYRTTLWNAIMGYIDIDEAIADLNTRYNQAYDEDVSLGFVRRLVVEDYDPLHPSAGTVTWLEQ